MKKHFLTIALLLSSIFIYAQTGVEDGQLIKNPSFEDEAKPIRNRRFGPNGEGELFGGYPPAGFIPGWIIANNQEEVSKIELTTEALLDETQHNALRWTIADATTATPAIMANVGHHGIEAIKGNKYTLTFWARADKKYRGDLLVGLQSKSLDGTWHAQASVKGTIKKKWKKYTITFTAEHSAEKARFVISAAMPGTLYFDEVSLYSPAAIKR